MLDALTTEDLDLFSPELRRDPYPWYRHLRREAPLYRSRRHDAWIVSRHNDAVTLLGHPMVRHWAEGNGDSGFAGVVARWMSMLDPRRQQQMRRLVAPIFAPRALEGLQAELANLAEQLLDAAAPAGHIDVVGGYAEPIALAALARIAGIPRDRTLAFHQSMRGMAGRLLAAVGAPDGSEATCIGLLHDLLSGTEPAPDSLLGVLRTLMRDGEVRDDAEAVAFLLLFLFAGHENMMNFIGNAVLALVEATDQLALLQATPALTASAVDELMRFESPVQFMSISLAQPVAIRGETIAAGDTVLICIGAANRDEARFADADQLDITRQDRAQLGFGHGPFTCIGAALARLQGAIAIGALVRRLNRPAILGPLRLRRDPPVLRGFVALDLAFGA
jgi:pimeloyl-[acyl-carrier protein] synthase